MTQRPRVARAADGMKRALGADHPDTRDACLYHAHWVGKSGRAAKAVQILDPLAVAFAERLGEDHPDAATARDDLDYWAREAAMQDWEPPPRPRPAEVGADGGPSPAAHILMVKLRHIEPTVWRAMEVPSDMPLSRLASALRPVMGWDDDGYHSHMFTASDGARYWKPPDEYFDDVAGDDSSRTVADVLPDAGAKLEWEYDLGDGWKHDITAHSIVPAGGDTGIALCLDGGGRCPPEDSGGLAGYAALRAAVDDPSDWRHEEAVAHFAGDPDSGIPIGPINPR